MMVRLEFPIDSGFKGIPPTVMVPVRNLRPEELESLRGATSDEVLGVVTGLSPDAVARLTPNDRAAIIAARREIGR